MRSLKDICKGIELECGKTKDLQIGALQDDLSSQSGHQTIGMPVFDMFHFI